MAPLSVRGCRQVHDLASYARKGCRPLAVMRQHVLRLRAKRGNRCSPTALSTHTKCGKSGALRAATRLDLHQSQKDTPSASRINHRGRGNDGLRQRRRVTRTSQCAGSKVWLRRRVDERRNSRGHSLKSQAFERLVIAHQAQVALTHLREQTVPLANSLEQLIAWAINLNHAEFREFAHPNMGKPT